VPAAAVLPSASVAEPGGRPVTAGDTTIAVGPEGGWTVEELDLAADRVSLGPNVLRVETAAVVAVSLMVANGGSG
jgi:RsmE family RNA methyltransferase